LAPFLPQAIRIPRRIVYRLQDKRQQQPQSQA
jgi:hypothetical protein